MTSPLSVIINKDLDAKRNKSLKKGGHEKYLKIKKLRSLTKTKFVMNKNSLAAALQTWDEASNARGDKSQKQKSEHRCVINASETIPDDTEHVKTFGKVFSFLSTFAQFFGIVTSYDWVPKRHIKWLFTICLIIFTWFSIFYTQYTHIKSGNILRVLEACALYGMALSLFVVGATLCLCCFVACPINAYIYESELMSLLPLDIVFTDQSTYLGYAIANFTMIIMGLFATFGTVFYGNVFIFSIFNYSMQVELIGEDLRDLDRMWTDDIDISMAYKKVYLKNICNKRQDLKNYMDEVKDIFGTKLCFYFYFNYFSQIICLFEVTKNDWTPGLPIAIVLFIEMMFYCIMGTQINVADEKLCHMIYSTNWYTYDFQSQRTILLLLHECQNAKLLQLGALGPLNVMTGIEIIKSIYTYYTLLSELF